LHDVDWLSTHMCHAEFGKYKAKSPAKITDIIDTENVLKLF